MNSVDVKLNYFTSKLEQVNESKRSAMMLEGKFNEEFGTWLKEQGVPEQTSMLEIIKHFRKKSTQLIAP